MLFSNEQKARREKSESINHSLQEILIMMNNTGINFQMFYMKQMF